MIGRENVAKLESALRAMRPIAKMINNEDTEHVQAEVKPGGKGKHNAKHKGPRSHTELNFAEEFFGLMDNLQDLNWTVLEQSQFKIFGMVPQRSCSRPDG